MSSYVKMIPDFTPFETAQRWMRKNTFQIFVQGTTFAQFFMYYIAKKNFGEIQKNFF